MSNKIKVPMKVHINKMNAYPSIDYPFSNDLRLDIELMPLSLKQSFTIRSNESIAELEHINRLFNYYIEQFKSVDMQTLYAIHYMLKSARVDNAFDMIELNKQLLPMLDEVIAQADPDNYELEIIK